MTVEHHPNGARIRPPTLTVLDHSARGRNLGRTLAQHTIDGAKRRGRAKRGLFLVPTTAGNRRLYEKLDCEVLGTGMRQTFEP